MRLKLEHETKKSKNLELQLEKEKQKSTNLRKDVLDLENMLYGLSMEEGTPIEKLQEGKHYKFLNKVVILN